MIRKLHDPERFRTTYYGARRYIDPLPADDRWEPTGDKERLPNVTGLAKAVDTGAFWKKVDDAKVSLDALRAADYAVGAWGRLADMPADERRLAIAQSAGRDLQRAADRGTAVHAMIEALQRGEAPMILEGDAEPYREVAEAVAAEFADLIEWAEVVAFARNDHGPHYGGTADGVGPRVILDYKTRGPDSKHGCYPKEVAQLGLLAMTDYMIVPTADGGAERVPTPAVDELLVVSIRPDGFEVYPVDVEQAKEVARHALDIDAGRRTAQRLSREATSTPRHTAASPSDASPPSASDPAGPEVPSASPGAPSGPAPSDRPADPGNNATEALGGTVERPSDSRGPLVDAFAARYAEAQAAGLDKAAVAAVWPDGVPGPARMDQWTTEDAQAAWDTLERLCDGMGLPFAADPTATPHEPRVAVPPKLAAVPDPEPMRDHGDPGPVMDDDSVSALRKRFSELDEVQRSTVLRWAAQGVEAGRAWQMPPHGVPRRAWEAARAAVELAGRTDDDETARGWIALVIGEDDCQTHPPGALIGSLTIEEADALTSLAFLHDTFAAALAAS